MKKILFIIFVNFLFFQNFSYTLYVNEIDIDCFNGVIFQWKDYITKQNYSEDLKKGILYKNFEAIFHESFPNTVKLVKNGTEKSYDIVEPHFFTASYDNKIQGMMILDYKFGKDTIKVIALCSAPWNLFGTEEEKFRGAGSALIENAKLIARENKFLKIDLYILPGSEKFYMDRGFKKGNDGEGSDDYYVFHLPVFYSYYDPKGSILDNGLKDYLKTI